MRKRPSAGFRRPQSSASKPSVRRPSRPAAAVSQKAVRKAVPYVFREEPEPRRALVLYSTGMSGNDIIVPSPSVQVRRVDLSDESGFTVRAGAEYVITGVTDRGDDVLIKARTTGADGDDLSITDLVFRASQDA